MAGVIDSITGAVKGVVEKVTGSKPAKAKPHPKPTGGKAGTTSPRKRAKTNPDGAPRPATQGGGGPRRRRRRTGSRGMVVAASKQPVLPSPHAARSGCSWRRR